MYDAIMIALADAKRRELLLALVESNPQVVPPDSTQLTAEERQRRQISYYHNHLPKLEELGFITWDEESMEVEKGPNFEYLKPVLLFLEEHSRELPEEHTVGV